MNYNDKTYDNCYSAELRVTYRDESAFAYFEAENMDDDYVMVEMNSDELTRLRDQLNAILKVMS